MSAEKFDLIGDVEWAERRFGAQQKPTVMQVHHRDKCAGEWCCIHNPSDHPLNTARLDFRFDRGFAERICDHGVGHPDPDSLAFLSRVMDPEDYRRRAFGVHGCDGCCVATSIHSVTPEGDNRG